eukprot:5939974-Pyramimonas_sp.AAC.1
MFREALRFDPAHSYACKELYEVPGLLRKSAQAGSAVSSHIDRGCRFSVLNSSCRRATDIISTQTDSELSGAFI